MSALSPSRGARRLAGSAVLLAGGALAGGCCTVFSLGWERGYGAEATTRIEPLDAAIAGQARVGSDGSFDAATCAAGCQSPPPGAHVTRCDPVEIELERREGRFVHCTQAAPPYEYWRPIDAGALAAAEADRAKIEDVKQQGALFERVCGAVPEGFDNRFNEWRAEIPPTAPAPGARFVACRYEKPGGCAPNVP